MGRALLADTLGHVLPLMSGRCWPAAPRACPTGGHETVAQIAVMSTARVLMRTIRPVIDDSYGAARRLVAKLARVSGPPRR